MKSAPYISIVIPAFNEARRITRHLTSISAHFKTRPLPYEVIVVDDGSTDDTAKAVEKAASRDHSIRLIGYPKNRGKGYAVKVGMEHARGTLRLFSDADGSVSIDHVDRFIGEIGNGADIVIGSIGVAGSSVREGAAWYRRGLGRAAKALIRFIATPGIRDTQRGFKLFTEQAARDIFSRQTIERWGFDIELLVIARLHGYQVSELPVSWVNPAGSTVDADRFAYVRTFSELARIVFRLIGGAYGAGSFNRFLASRKLS